MPFRSQADQTTPRWDNKETKPGQTVTVPNTGDTFPAPKGDQEPTKVEAKPTNGDFTVTVTDPKTGEISVTAPTDAKTGDKTTVEVTDTYPDGSQDKEKFTVTVVDPQNPGNTGQETTPNWDNQETKPNTPVVVENTGDPIPEGSTVAARPDDNNWKVETTPDGTITVVPPTDATTGKTETPSM